MRESHLDVAAAWINLHDRLVHIAGMNAMRNPTPIAHSRTTPNHWSDVPPDSRGTFHCDISGAAFSHVVRVRRSRPRLSDGSNPAPPLCRLGRDHRVKIAGLGGLTVSRDGRGALASVTERWESDTMVAQGVR